MKKPGIIVTLALSGALISAPTWAEDVVIESRSVASWQRTPGGHTSISGERWLQIQTQMESMQRELQLLRGLAEENRYQIDQLDNQQQALYTEAQKVDVPVVAQVTELQEISPSLPIAPAIQAAPFPADDHEAYQLAYSQLQSKDYVAAVATLKQYLIVFADSGEYLPNVHYWLGEIHLIGGDVDAADIAFETVVTQYPNHQKASDALLKRGYVQYTKENWTMARAYFNDVKARFAGSAAARLAETRLIQMKQNNQS